MSENPITQPASGDQLALKPGDIFWNNYRIVSLIGKGGVSSVYKAERVDNKQLVAIKVLHAQKSRDEELVRRFIRECQTTSKLEHPNAIKIFEWGIDNQERPFMVIEYLSGDTLAKRIQRSNGLHCAKAVEIMEQICSAIGEAHSLGIIHRDLKPDNIMLTTHNGLDDWVKVVDFGIAKIETAADDPQAVNQANLTRAGAILGTPLYMSPEQLRGRRADARSDIYALGVIMYEMLTGKPPFLSKNTAEVVVGHLNVVPEAPSKIRMDLNIPAALDAATMRALAKNPWERPTTVQEFCNTVTKAMEKPVTKTRSAKDVLENVMHPPKKNETPTPHGMVVDPVKKVCPNCKALSTGANYKYCLKCGQDNTNKWLPYHKKARKGGFDPIVFFQRYRTVLALLVLACVLGFSLHSYLEAGAELTGRFTGHLDHVMFAKDPLPPGVAKNLRVRDLEMLLSQNGEKVSGLITTKLGQGAVEGTVTAVSPMITSYELTGDIDKAGGTLDIEMTGMFDKVARTEDWTVKQYFHGPGIKPIASVAKMSLSKVKE